MTGRDGDKPIACVMGEMDLVRALAMGGIRSAVLAPPGTPVRYSSATIEVLDWADAWSDPSAALERVLGFARRQHIKPVLFYDGDWELLVVSRNRDLLRDAFNFVAADAPLVEALVDKGRFAELAERYALPVPRSVVLPAGGAVEEVRLSFPVVAKPLRRQAATLTKISGGAKAFYARDRDELQSAAYALAAAGIDALVQEAVPGPESRIESYHVYIDAQGEIVGEFTGRKLRTSPPSFGYTTALVITNELDVRDLGRDIVRRLSLTGVAKLDFKRGPDGSLHLLEINPRFNLWHHPGARAGVNLPLLVFCDLVGLTRPVVGPVREGIRWCAMRQDQRVAVGSGMSTLAWLSWAIRCETKAGFALSDPLPLLWAAANRAAERLRSGHTDA